MMSGCVQDQLACWRNWFGKHSSEVWNLMCDAVIMEGREIIVLLRM